MQYSVDWEDDLNDKPEEVKETGHDVF